MNEKLDAVKGCGYDNWGQPHQKRAPYTTNYPEIQQRCAATFKEETAMAERLPDGMVNFYESTAAFSAFRGEDWVPENHHLFPPYNTWGGLTPTGEKGSMKGTTCDTVMDDGSTWTITRVGPIVTTGCYDWVQVGWNDIFDMSEKLKIHPEGVFIVEQFSGPVNRNGDRLSHPPIHVHHIHVDPIGIGGIKQRIDPVKCLRNETFCYDPRRVMEHHGDYECREEDGGLNCFSETVPDGYGKFVTTPLQVEGDMNDVRACNSEPFEYYYQIGARWVPKVAADGTVSTLKPINFYNYIGGGNVNPNDQSTLILTFQVPTASDSLYWYAGRMPHGGELLRNKMHVHNKVFKEYILFKATPYELGLTKENGLLPEKVYRPIPLPETQFANLDEAKAFFLQNLDVSAERFDSYSEAELEEILKNYGTTDLYSRDRPEAVCQSVQDLIEIDGYFYDRKAPTCCKPWHTKKDDIYTVIGFIPKLQHALGPHTDAWPETFPSHVSMWMAWENEDEPPQSHFGILVQTQDPSGYLKSDEFNLVLRLATMLNGGTLSNHNIAFHEYVIPANIVAVFIYYPTTMGVLMLLLLLLLVLKCYKSMCKKASVDEIPMPRKKRVGAGGDVEIGDRVCPDPEEVIQNIADKVTSVADDENIRALKAK